MKELTLKLLGTILPKRLLMKWKTLPINTFRWNVCDYAPVKRKIM